MSYSSAVDIQSEFKSSTTFSATTAVTDTQIAGFIAQADALIDSRIGLKYRLPISDAAALLILKNISIAMVAERARDIMKVMTGNAETSQQTRPKGGMTSPTSPWAMLDAIVCGNMILGGAPLVSSVDGVSSGTVVDSVEMEMDVDRVQW